MQQWFKYEFGYVNIDSENLFLTNSGNWSETIELTEKTVKVENINDSRRSSIIVFFGIAVCIFVYLISRSIINGNVGLTLIALIIFGGYKAYQYLKTGIGSRFKIPRTKISKIIVNGRSVEIFFINGEGNEDRYKLQSVEEKGLPIMKSFSQYSA